MIDVRGDVVVRVVFEFLVVFVGIVVVRTRARGIAGRFFPLKCWAKVQVVVCVGELVVCKRHLVVCCVLVRFVGCCCCC